MLHGGWLAKKMSIWMGRLGGPTGDSCCMGVGLYKECLYGWAGWRDQLEIVVVWGLACSGAWVQPKLGWAFLLPTCVRPDVVFSFFSKTAQNWILNHKLTNKMVSKLG